MAGTTLPSVLCAVLLVAGKAAAQCSVNGVDYSGLINNGVDYIAQSTSYQNYEFVFNVCRSLVWSEGECVTGSAICERLKSTKTATDVYGTYSTQTFASDVDGPYSTMKGDDCLFGTGEAMTSKIYFACGDTEAAEVIHESYYDCEVFVKITSPNACSGGNPSGQSGALEEAEDVGMYLCIFLFVGIWVYFAVGAAFLHKKGERGAELVIHKGFWSTIPGLVKDGMQFSHAKGKEWYEKARNKGDGNYSELK